MTLKLKGSTSGYVALDAPSSAGDNTLTLPTTNGSADQLLKTDGSGNLSWTDDNSGVSLTGSTNNTIATVTGANAIQGEANLTFDGSTLALAGNMQFTAANAQIELNNGGPRFWSPSANTLTIHTGGGLGSSSNERLRIDSGGRLLIGQTSGFDLYANGLLQVSATSGTAAISVNRFSNNGSSPYINLGKSRGGIGTYTIVQDDDRLGQINFCGADGNDLASPAAGIAGYVDGTPGSNDMPGRLVFFTASDNVTVAETERLIIDSTGKVLFLGTGAGSGSRGLEIATESVGAADEGVIFNARASGTTGRLTFKTNSATAMTILGNGGNVGIGTTSPAYNLDIKDGTSARVAIDVTTGSDASIIMDGINADFTGSDYWSLNAQSTGEFAILKASSEKFRIESTGRIYTKTDQSTAGLIIQNTVHDSQLRIEASAANKNSVIHFADGADGDVGIIDYDHNDNSLAFTVNASERLSILSDGTAIFDPNAGGTLSITGSSAHTSKVIIGDNANTGAGNCLVEGADGGDYFTIQSNGNVKFATGNGITFDDSSTSAVLDDYEEGTFTPLLGGSNYGTYNITGEGKYTKIGRIIQFQVVFQNKDLSNSASGAARVRGWPYAAETTSTRAIVPLSMMHYVDLPSDGSPNTYNLYSDGISFYALYSRSGTSWNDMAISNFHTSGMYLEFTGTYQAA